MYERNPAEVDRLTSDLIELSTRQNFAYWLQLANIYRGWARSASGDTAKGIPCIEPGITDLRATGAVLNLPTWLALKAEALHLAGHTSEALAAISEAEALAERYEIGVCCSQLHRLRGVFLATLGGDETQIEASFCAAINTAKQEYRMNVATNKTEARWDNPMLPVDLIFEQQNRRCARTRRVRPKEPVNRPPANNF